MSNGCYAPVRILPAPSGWIIECWECDEANGLYDVGAWTRSAATHADAAAIASRHTARYHAVA